MTRRTPTPSTSLPAMILLAVTSLAMLAPPAASAQTGAGPLAVEIDAAATQVTFDVGATGHDVEGSFAFEKGELRFDPTTGKASGELVADATSGKTGNNSRDKTMNKKVLESDKFPTFTLRPEQVLGTLPTEGEGTVTIKGTLEVHGGTHPVTIEARVERSGDRFTATAKFPVPYVEWGMHSPSILFLKVDDVVHVTVQTAGRLVPADGGEMAADGR